MKKLTGTKNIYVNALVFAVLTFIALSVIAIIFNVLTTNVHYSYNI